MTLAKVILPLQVPSILELGVEERERGVRVRSSYGAFNTYKQLVLWAPEEASKDTFGAVQYMGTDGFGENRAGESGSGIFQHRFGEGELTFRTIGILHAARSNMAGVLRQEDVANGQVCFTCVYSYPTAQAQNALANRFLAGGFADYEGNDGANGQMGVWLGYDNFFEFRVTSRAFFRSLKCSSALADVVI